MNINILFIYYNYTFNILNNTAIQNEQLVFYDPKHMQYFILINL